MQNFDENGKINKTTRIICGLNSESINRIEKLINMKTLQIIFFFLMVASLVCGNNNVSNLISGLRNLTTINDDKMPISEQSEIYETSMIAKKELLKLIETNKSITVIIGNELLNTPLPKNRSYGDLLYVFELAKVLEKQD